MMGMRSMTEELKGIEIWWVAGQAFIVTELASHVDLFIKFTSVDPEVCPHTNLSLIVH